MIFPPYTRPDQTDLDQLADFLLLGAGIGVALFAVVYAVVFRWYKTPAGIAILGFTVALSLILGLILFGRLAGGDYDGRDLVRVIVYGSNFLASWGMVALLAYGWWRGNKPLALVERERMKRTQTPDATGAPQESPQGGSE